MTQTSAAPPTSHIGSADRLTGTNRVSPANFHDVATACPAGEVAYHGLGLVLTSDRKTNRCKSGQFSRRATASFTPHDRVPHGETAYH
jgi:hypothetical protein